MEGWNFFPVFQNGFGFGTDFLPVGGELTEEWKMDCIENWRITNFGLAAHDIAQIAEQLFAPALDEFAPLVAEALLGFLLWQFCFWHHHGTIRALLLAVRLGYHCGMNKASQAMTTGTKRRVIVVGAGIMGASFAWHLARAGVDVLVFDERPGAGEIATANSWAWINSSWGNPEPYFRLRHRSMTLWRELAQHIPDLRVNWCGGLLWDLPGQDLVAFAKLHGEWGYGVRLVEKAEIAKLEPRLRQLPDLAAHVGEEGMVEPVAAANAMVKAAEALGAKFMWNSGVEDLITADNGVIGVCTTEAEYIADEVVLANGLGAAPLITQLGYDFAIDGPPGLLVHTSPLPPVLNGLVMSPHLHVRQSAEGRLVAGSDFGGMEPGDDPAGAAQKLFTELRQFLLGADNMKLDFHTVGFRPTPRDGVSAIGRVKNTNGLYICVTHSGITLAPVLGDLGAAEILTGNRDHLLQGFSPDRLLEPVA